VPGACVGTCARRFLQKRRHRLRTHPIMLTMSVTALEGAAGLGRAGRAAQAGAARAELRDQAAEVALQRRLAFCVRAPRVRAQEPRCLPAGPLA